MKLTFLGTRGEIEARRARHWRHSALLVSYGRRRVLVDCGADWADQLDQIGMHAIVLTHAHPDHAFGLKRGAPCPVWATAACWQSIGRFPIAERYTIRARKTVAVQGIQFEAFPVEHSLLAPAVGYQITAGPVRVFMHPIWCSSCNAGRRCVGSASISAMAQRSRVLWCAGAAHD
jgi:glyoxylase-like metal-dependent hydrolase (beta-lactamase superfamily II)